MSKLTTNQIAALKTLKNAPKSFFNGDSSKMYASSVGCNGAAIKALVNAGLIEKLNHKVYRQMYRVTAEGNKALKAVR